MILFDYLWGWLGRGITPPTPVVVSCAKAGVEAAVGIDVGVQGISSTLRVSPVTLARVGAEVCTGDCR